MNKGFRSFIFLLILLFASILSELFFPQFTEGLKVNSIFDTGYLTFLLEKSFPSLFPYFVKSVVAITLFFFLRKNPRSFLLCFVIAIIIPSSGEFLIFPLLLVASFSPFYLSLIVTFIIPFFSKASVLAIISILILRLILFEKSKEFYAPLFGFLSPPIIYSIFKGDLFLPFLLSICGFPQYKPISLITPIFIFFVIALFILVNEKGKTIAKAFLSLFSFLFLPLSFAVSIPLVKGERKNLNYLFLFPLLFFFIFPPSSNKISEGLKDELEKISSPNCEVVVDTELYNKVGSTFPDLILKPQIKTSSLIQYYKNLPFRPPLIGYPVYDSNILISKPFYPKTPNFREYEKGWQLLWCGSKFVLFGKEDFLKSEKNLIPLAYSPYHRFQPDSETTEKVLKDLDKLTKMDPQFFEGLRDRGRILIDLKREEEAIQSFNSALKIKESGEIFNDLGVCYFNLGKYDDAIKCYFKAIELSPKDILPRMSCAYTLMVSGRLDDARVILEDLNRAYPTFYPAFRLNSQVVAKMGDIEKSKEILRNIPRDLRTKDESELLGEK
jgi:hypothetical protein